MNHRTWMSLLGLGAFVAQGAAWAQTAGAMQQKVTGPQARYWLGAETASGMAMPGMGGGGTAETGGGLGAMAGMMGALMSGGGVGAPRKSLRLELGGVRTGNPSEARHTVPTALAMGESLSLLGPEKGTPAAERPERDVPEPPDGKAKGRMLFFWGCGERAGPCQPVVLDFEKLSQGVLPPDMRSNINLRAFRQGPAMGRDAGYADWPNRKNSKTVPSQASLVGDHLVQGNFVPDIRFAVGGAHDFMEALSLKQAKATSGAQQLQWNRVPTALGHFATAMGFKQGAGDSADIVFWNASSTKLLGGEQLMGYLPPAETERLVKARVLLSADTTQCAIPAEAVAAAGGGMTWINLNAFGPELNVVHPPRPEDPKVTWEQEYAVKMRLRSYTGMLGDMENLSAQRSNKADEPASRTEEKKEPSPTDQVKNALKGLFGR